MFTETDTLHKQVEGYSLADPAYRGLLFIGFALFMDPILFTTWHAHAVTGSVIVQHNRYILSGSLFTRFARIRCCSQHDGYALFTDPLLLNMTGTHCSLWYTPSVPVIVDVLNNSSVFTKLNIVATWGFWITQAFSRSLTLWPRGVSTEMHVPPVYPCPREVTARPLYPCPRTARHAQPLACTRHLFTPAHVGFLLDLFTSAHTRRATLSRSPARAQSLACTPNRRPHTLAFNALVCYARPTTGRSHSMHSLPLRTSELS